MIATMVQKIEIRFWDVIIPAMSDSPTFRKLIVRASRVARCRVVAHVLARGLDLLGLQAPEPM